MKVAIPREMHAGETRVAAVPETVRQLKAAGLEVAVESGAGAASFVRDEDFQAAGATIETDHAALLRSADIVLKVRPPDAATEVPLLKPGAVLVCLLQAAQNPQAVEKLAAANITTFAMELIPRISRAQNMDVLTSMATVAGYKAVLLAAGTLARMMPMMMTASGTINPASVLVIGAGVAGLQAIATAKRLGAVVRAVDTRPAVKEQIESLGAKFIALEVTHDAEATGGYAADLGEQFYAQEQQVLAPHVKTSDIVITSALIPGRRAPLLITEAMVGAMKPGSVIVDLAAEQGGNCSLTRPGETVNRGGVTVLGPPNLPALLPVHASVMFARNVMAFMKELIREGRVHVNRQDEVIGQTLATYEGQVVSEPLRQAMQNARSRT